MHRQDLRNMGVVSLTVFGSTARDESTQHSDIDLLVEFDRDAGLFHLFEVQHRLEEIIGVHKIDLIQKGALHPALREPILSEAKGTDPNLFVFGNRDGNCSIF